MRVAGFSPRQAARTLARIGAVFVVLAVVFGELIGAERRAGGAAAAARADRQRGRIGAADRDLGEVRHPVRQRGRGARRTRP